MMLAELKRLAEEQGLLENPHYEPKPVKYLITVDDSGKCLGVQSTLEPPAAGEKGKPRPRSFPIPRQSGRTSGDKAEFLVDKAEYVFGFGEREPEKLRLRRHLFRQEIEEAAKATGDPGVKAVLLFLERSEATDVSAQLPKDVASNDLFAFVYAPDIDRLVSSREAVASYWAAKREGSGSEETPTTCLVCGAARPPVDKHPPLKYVPGGSTSGVSLVSFNSAAFESYGLERSENAPLCRPCADGYTTGLNRLLHPSYPGPSGPLRTQNHRISADTVAVFWSRSGGDFDDLFAELLQGDPDAVAALLGSPWKGAPPPTDADAPFFLAILSGAQGRAVLRDWIETSIPAVTQSLRRYFEDISLVRRYPDEPGAIPLRQILKALAVRGDDKDLAPALAGQLFEAALLGSLYPNAALDAALRRLRAETDFSRPRIALIKALLRRNHKMEVTEEMDSSNTQIGYRLGRLFAVLERLQGAAINNANATIVDRYYGAASSTPVIVFPRLLSLAQHHASKAENGGYFQKLIEEIVEPIDPASAFPSNLDLVGQGLFALGYYHQRASLWKKKVPESKSPENV